MSDRVGDAGRAFDVRWVRYDNADKAVTYTVKVAALTPQTAIGGYMAEPDDYDGYEFAAWRTSTGATRHALNYIYGASGYTRVHCAGMTVRWLPAMGQARVRIPRNCVAQVNGRLRMEAHTSKRASKWSSIDTAPERRLRQG